jgi:hypothetical protein
MYWNGKVDGCVCFPFHIVVLWWSLPIVLVIVVVVLHCAAVVVGAGSLSGRCCHRSPLMLVIAVVIELVPEKCS